MHGKGKDVLRQIRELFCLREFVVSSNQRPASDSQQAIFLEESLNKVLFDSFLSPGRENKQLAVSQQWAVSQQFAVSSKCCQFDTVLILVDIRLC